jgi:hypothetical protein
LNVTALAPMKFVPETVTVDPALPLAGLKPVIEGGAGEAGLTVNGELLVAVPALVETVIAPLLAVAGTVAVIRLLDATLKAALARLNATDRTPVKFEPEITTVVPTGPLDGLNPEIDG